MIGRVRKGERGSRGGRAPQTRTNIWLGLGCHFSEGFGMGIVAQEGLQDSGSQDRPYINAGPLPCCLSRVRRMQAMLWIYRNEQFHN